MFPFQICIFKQRPRWNINTRLCVFFLLHAHKCKVGMHNYLFPLRCDPFFFFFLTVSMTGDRMLISICIINEWCFKLTRSLVKFSLHRYASAGGKIAYDCQVQVYFPFASLFQIISQTIFINLHSGIMVLFVL